MRIRFAKFVAFFIVFVNIVVVYYTLKLFISFSTPNVSVQTEIQRQPATKPALKHASKLLTIIIREFESHENDVAQTVKSFITHFPNIHLFVICDTFPYPPLELSSRNTSFKNVKLFSLAPSFHSSFLDHYPLFHVKTKYVLFVPDSTRLPSRQILHLLLTDLIKQPEHALSAPVGPRTPLNCLKVNVSSRTWSLKYEMARDSVCDAVSGKHVLMIATDVLRRLQNAFLLPFPQALYLQTAFLEFKVSVHW